jgi:hypothetical protein
MYQAARASGIFTRLRGNDVAVSRSDTVL